MPRNLKNIGKAMRLIATHSQTRKSHLYCVGTAKSGTHSISSMFNSKVRSQHEPTSDKMIEYIIQAHLGKLSESEIRNYLIRRDRKLHLDIDSSQLNFFFLRNILNEFKDGFFLLTIRDCYSWLNSFINDSLRRDTTSNWIRLRELRFGADIHQHTLEEQPLKERGLYTLDGYLSYWAEHNSKVLDMVPKDKLLVIRTDQISDSAYKIADFCGLSTNTVVPEKTHSFKNPSKYRVLDLIEQDYLETKVQKHCSRIMELFFPEINSIEKAEL